MLFANIEKVLDDFSHSPREYFKYLQGTECFTDLCKLNLTMVHGGSVLSSSNFCYCPSCLKKWSSLLKWSKLTQNNWFAYNGLNPWNSLYLHMINLILVPLLSIILTNEMNSWNLKIGMITNCHKGCEFECLPIQLFLHYVWNPLSPLSIWVYVTCREFKIQAKWNIRLLII